MSVPNKKKKVVLPLLHVLNSLSPDKRTIILAHLDFRTLDDLYQVTKHVLHTPKLPDLSREYLGKKLLPFKDTFRYLGNDAKSRGSKRKKLMQVGGGPFKHILATAIPLLLDTYKKID